MTLNLPGIWAAAGVSLPSVSGTAICAAVKSRTQLPTYLR
jgi:hypothetical protein